MKLYFTPGACSLAAHIVLREARLSFDLDKVDLASKTTEDGTDFNTVNPKGQVPALVLDDGSLLTEVPAILQYLADRRPEAALAPAPRALARYRLQEWLNFITAELHKGMSVLFRPDLPEGWAATVKAGVATKLGYLDSHLAGREFLVGDGFSIADSYAFTIVNWTYLFDITLDLWPNLQRHMQRIGARPSVREALRAEGLTVTENAAANDAEYASATSASGA